MKREVRCESLQQIVALGNTLQRKTHTNLTCGNINEDYDTVVVTYGTTDASYHVNDVVFNVTI